MARCLGTVIVGNDDYISTAATVNIIFCQSKGCRNYQDADYVKIVLHGGDIVEFAKRDYDQINNAVVSGGRIVLIADYIKNKTVMPLQGVLFNECE
jgi:hypothetical protein